MTNQLLTFFSEKGGAPWRSEGERPVHDVDDAQESKTGFPAAGVVTITNCHQVYSPDKLSKRCMKILAFSTGMSYADIGLFRIAESNDCAWLHPVHLVEISSTVGVRRMVDMPYCPTIACRFLSWALGKCWAAIQLRGDFSFSKLLKTSSWDACGLLRRKLLYSWSRQNCTEFPSDSALLIWYRWK